MRIYKLLKKIYITDEAMAAAFRVRRQAITYWKIKGVPIGRAEQVEKVTSGKITIADVVKG